jgi:hypothetical protein
MDRRQRRRLRLHERLAEEKREAGAEQHEPDAYRDVVDSRQAAYRSMQQPEREAG